MKHFTRIWALLLVFTIFMSTSVSAATVVEGDNGKTIDVWITFTADKYGEDVITEVKAGDAFYVMINFDGNPVDSLENSLGSFNLLIEYDENDVTLGSRQVVLVSPTVKSSFNTGLAYASWADPEYGVIDDDENIVKSGILFGIKATAMVDLTADDINDFVFVDKGTGTNGTENIAKMGDCNTTKTYFTINAREKTAKPTITGSADVTGRNVKVISSEPLNTLGSGLTVYVGVYNLNHELVDAKFEDYQSTGNDLLVDTTDASYYKAFVWDENRRPVVDAIKFGKDV